MFIMSMTLPRKYNTEAMTACQKPWDQISPGPMGGANACMATAIPMSFAGQREAREAGRSQRGHTSAEDNIQKRMDAGRAMIYLTLEVKLRRRKKLPRKPQARDKALKMISLAIRVRARSFGRDSSNKAGGRPFRIPNADSVFVGSLGELPIVWQGDPPRR